MDSPAELPRRPRGRRLSKFGISFAFALSLLIFVCLFASFLVGIAAVLLRGISLSPTAVPSPCRIISSSVDLRLSKICELGLLNYKAKHVFYPSERKKFRCRYDYYWASVFKVEYIDHSSGEMRTAVAESPNEALPHACRPDFGAAWLTKDKFKVNETYECGYTSGVSHMSIYNDNLFRCQAKDPSGIEMFRRYAMLVPKICSSLSSRKGSKYPGWEMLAGVIMGFFTAFIFSASAIILRQVLYELRGMVLARLKRASIFMAYFCFLGWLAVQYGKRLGLVQIFRACYE